MRNRSYLIAIFMVLTTIFICCDNRIPSTTGAFLLSNNFYRDSLTWNVSLLTPFEIDTTTISKPNNHRQYLLDPDGHFPDRASIVKSFQFTAISSVIDSIEPSTYHVWIQCQIAYNQTNIDSTAYVEKGETLYAVPDFINPSFVYKPILISNVRISADSSSHIIIDSLLELKESMNDDILPIDIYYREIVYYEWNNIIRQKD